MSVGDQFKGLDISYLIGAPLMAAADASLSLAQSTASFINKVGFDSENHARIAQFKYHNKTPDPDGNMSDNEMAVEVPLLAIVPIPNLQVDEVNVLFDMEVKQSERVEAAVDSQTDISGGMNLGFVKVSVRGSVATHNSNTRSTDNSAKYHVDVRATNHGIPEGLARVMDMMAATISPALLSSRPVDPMGNELAGARRNRNLEMKRLREEKFQLENAVGAAQNTWELKLKSLHDRGEALSASVRSKLMKVQSDNAEERGKEQTPEQKAGAELDANDAYWRDFQTTLKENVTVAAEAETPPTLASMRPEHKQGSDCPPDVTSLELSFTEAIKAYQNWQKTVRGLEENQTNYNAVMMDLPPKEQPVESPA